jgi:hypothetical protein
LIPDVPAVYFVEPTAENLKHITSDLSSKLYTTAYINFLSSVPRPLLEEFATAIAATNTSEYISQVYDQYLNFIVSEPDLFSLGMGKDTYWTMNSSRTTDEELTASVERIVSGLFSVVVTTGKFYHTFCCQGGGLTWSKGPFLLSAARRGLLRKWLRLVLTESYGTIY